MRACAVAILVCCACGGASALPPVPLTSLGSCPVFPASSAWNTDISSAPVDPHSADYLAFMNASALKLQPDFGGPYGQPVEVVPGTQPRVPMSFLYARESDPGPYPFPANVPVDPSDDKHAVVVDTDNCLAYETYLTVPDGDGYHADSGAIWNLRTGAPRPDGWTSATAAGLPILPGLARYDEAVEQGEIKHALSFVAGQTAPFYVSPATHTDGTSTAPYAPPMGLRVRLRAGFDLAQFHGASLAVLRALKTYGMFLTDTAGGDFWAVAGTLDPRWPHDDLQQLKTVPAEAFEVVELGPLHAGN